MLRHMIVARSAFQSEHPDLKAHGKFNCAYHRSGRRITDMIRSIFHFAGISAGKPKAH